MKKNLGKRLSVGDIFQTPSRRMDRYGYYYNGYRGDRSMKLKVRRPGDRGYFVKGKRRYYCEVKGIAETTTGVYCWQNIARPGMEPGNRWWKFVYVVQILEN